MEGRCEWGVKVRDVRREQQWLGLRGVGVGLLENGFTERVGIPRGAIKRKELGGGGVENL